MILSVAIVKGFQGEITKKVTGFEAHIKVVSLLEGTSDYNKLVIDRLLLEKLRNTENVAHVQLFARHPGIIENNDEIQGVIIKGVPAGHKSAFFNQYVKEGRMFDPGTESGKVLISSVIAERLAIKAGDRIRLYFVNRNGAVKPRNFEVTGVYNTGLELYDRQMVFISMPELQKIKEFGVRAFIAAEEAGDGRFMVEARAFGGGGNYRYEWSNGWKGKGPFPYKFQQDTTFTCIVSDASGTLPDTARIRFPSVESSSSGGSDKYYTEGYEIFLKDFDKIETTEERIYEETGSNLTTTNVRDEKPEIFNWLEILDMNVYILIVLMVVVALINMSSALLILILERTTMIGILKAIGTPDFRIRRIFLYNALLLIVKGLLYGNAAAVILAIIQQYTGIIQLPEKLYYLSVVPVDLNLTDILLLNAGTVLISMLVLVLPSFLITRLSPAKIVRYD